MRRWWKWSEVVAVVGSHGSWHIVHFSANWISCRRWLQFRGGSRIFFRRGCTRLFTWTPINHIVFSFLQNTSCIRKPQVISGGGGGGVRTLCTLPLDPPLQFIYNPEDLEKTSYAKDLQGTARNVSNELYRQSFCLTSILLVMHA